MTFDATRTISKVDKQLVADIVEAHKPCIFVVNKWDLALEREMTTRALGGLSGKDLREHAIRAGGVPHLAGRAERAAGGGSRAEPVQAGPGAGGDGQAERGGAGGDGEEPAADAEEPPAEDLLRHAGRGHAADDRAEVQRAGPAGRGLEALPAHPTAGAPAVPGDPRPPVFPPAGGRRTPRRTRGVADAGSRTSWAGLAGRSGAARRSAWRGRREPMGRGMERPERPRPAVTLALCGAALLAGTAAVVVLAPGPADAGSRDAARRRGRGSRPPAAAGWFAGWSNRAPPSAPARRWSNWRTRTGPPNCSPRTPPSPPSPRRLAAAERAAALDLAWRRSEVRRGVARVADGGGGTAPRAVRRRPRRGGAAGTGGRPEHPPAPSACGPAPPRRPPPPPTRWRRWTRRSPCPTFGRRS